MVKNISTKSIDTKIYRKPRRSNDTISYDSNGPFNYKTAAYRFYVKRSFQVCSEVYLNDELIKIKEIVCANGFSNKFINKLIYMNMKIVIRYLQMLAKLKKNPVLNFAVWIIFHNFLSGLGML